MSGPGANGEARPGTWGAFLRYAERHGVTVETLPNVKLPGGERGAADYLWNEQNDRTFPLPLGFSPSRKITLGMMAHVCARLGIPEPIWMIEPGG